ncbi:MAG: FAD-dependent oxidoreductase [Caldilineaceae bacterium]
MGSYCTPNADTQPDDRRAYAMPVDQRLYFAGEAADTDHYGTVHGPAVRRAAAARDPLRPAGD